MAAIPGLRLVAFLILLVGASMEASYIDADGRFADADEVRWRSAARDYVGGNQDMGYDNEDSTNVDYGNEYDTRIQDEDHDVQAQMEGLSRREAFPKWRWSWNPKPKSKPSCMRLNMERAGIPKDLWTGYEHLLGGYGATVEQIIKEADKHSIACTKEDFKKLRNCLKGKKPICTPCENGGKCEPKGSGYTCKCAEGFGGYYCGKPTKG